MRSLAAFFLLLPATLLLGQTPTITAVNGEDGPKFGLCPGGISFIQGTNLGGAGAVVTVAGKRAFVVNANGAALLQVELPVDAPLGATTLTVGASAPFNVTLVQYAPGVATDGQADNTVNAYHAANQTAVTASNPAAPGESIFVTATGLGPTKPVYATGTTPSNSDSSAATVVEPTVSVGGKNATVTASYLGSSPGFYQVVFTVPAVTNGIQPISVSIGGLTSGVANLPVSTLPTVASVTNAASYNDPALPNGPIAQGSIFVVKGVNLGPAALAIAPSAFQSATLSGTSVNVTVAGATVAALMYYTSATQLAALLPSNTPAGTGTITVTYSGQTGPARPITVVGSNVGIFTVTSDGGGAGIVTYPDYSLVSNVKAANCGGPNTTCGAANPGDALIVWATGLGPVNGSDAAGAGLGVNMTSVPLTIWLGGVQVPAVYQGRSGCCVGEDQIVFTVPANAPTGCAVPLTLQVNSLVSNTVALPIAAAGTRTCTGTKPNFPLSIVTQLVTGKGPFTFSQLSLSRSDNYPGLEDDFNSQFVRFSPVAAVQPFFFSYVDDAPRGTCNVFNTPNGPNQPLTPVAGLDAGTQATITGANGTKNIPGSGGGYKAVLSGNGSYFAPGQTTVSFPGGADVAAFSTAFTPSAFPTMTSPQPDAPSPTAVTKANGLTVTWTGGSAGVYVEIDGFNNTNQTGSTGAAFSCTVPSTAGSFTIPPAVLLAMPSGNLGGINFTPTFVIANYVAPGMDVNLATVQSSVFSPLNFK